MQKAPKLSKHGASSFMSLPKDFIDISPKTNFNAGCTCRPTVDRLLPLNYMTNYEVYCPHTLHIKQIKTNNYTK